MTVLGVDLGSGKNKAALAVVTDGLPVAFDCFTAGRQGEGIRAALESALQEYPRIEKIVTEVPFLCPGKPKASLIILRLLGVLYEVARRLGHPTVVEIPIQTWKMRNGLPGNCSPATYHAAVLAMFPWAEGKEPTEDEAAAFLIALAAGEKEEIQEEGGGGKRKGPR